MLTKIVIGLKLLIAAGIIIYCVVAYWADLWEPPTVGDLKDIGVVGLIFGIPPVFALVRVAFIILPVVIIYAAVEALLRGVRTFKIGKEGVEIGLVERATQTAEEALKEKTRTIQDLERRLRDREDEVQRLRRTAAEMLAQAILRARQEERHGGPESG
jgi:hypothetical protein